MGKIGSLHEWTRFLDAHSDDEAAAELSKHALRLDGVYEDLCTAILPLWDSPTGEVTDVLMAARSALTEAAGMLEQVRARFHAGEREIA